MRRVLAALAVVGLTLAACASPPAPKKSTPARHYATPHFGLVTCGADATTGLQNFINAQPSNTTITLPYHACYTMNGTIHINNTTGLTILGNGAQFDQTVAATDNSKRPFLWLDANSHLTIKNLTLNGAYNGSNGGAGREGQYGIYMEANDNVLLTGFHVNNVQGDFFSITAPFDVPGSTLNTNITITQSVFNTAGYHGVVVEGANGVLITRNTFENMAVDAMDFEYDIFSSGPPDSHGIGTFAAEDHVVVTNNVWNNWNNQWFVSIQGQTPGVQEQYNVFANNTLEESNGAYTGSFIWVEGTDPSMTTAPYYDSYLLFAHNHTAPGTTLTGVTGSSISSPFSGSSGLIQNNVHTVVTANTLSSFAGICPPAGNYFCNNGAYTPYLGAFYDTNNRDLTINNNIFSGALGVLNPSSAGSQNTKECNNQYGSPTGLSTSAAC